VVMAILTNISIYNGADLPRRSSLKLEQRVEL